MHKQEVQLNAPQQANDWLRDALALVNEIDPPADLRAAMFVKAVDLLAAKQVFFEQSPAILPGGLRGMQ